MPCHKPLHGFRSRVLNASGKRSITFSPSQGYRDMPVTVPCGQCKHCRLMRSRSWAIRCVHEASLWPENIFITLTYKPSELPFKGTPQEGSLNHADFQRFMKRLRKAYAPKKIRYYMAGEYGEKLGRPHYHAIIFNHTFNDLEYWKSNNGFALFKSKTLEKIWTHGFVSVGSATIESAGYVARYICKKITGEKAQDHYNTIDYSTGEITRELKPEYNRPSSRNGIGKDWLMHNFDDVYPSDFIIHNGKKISPPKYYDTQFEILYPEDYASHKLKRVAKATKANEDESHERLETKRIILEERSKLLKRSYDDGT